MEGGPQRLLFHKIVCRKPAGTPGLGRAAYSHLLAFWFDVAGLDRAMWADPVVNLKAAYVAYIEHERAFGDPWHAWTCKP